MSINFDLSTLFEAITIKYSEQKLPNEYYFHGTYAEDIDITKTQPGDFFEVLLVGIGDYNTVYYKSLSGKEMLIFQSKYDLTQFAGYEFPHSKI